MCDPIQGGGMPPMKPVGQAPPTSSGGPAAPQQATTPAPGTTVAGASGGAAQAAAGAGALGGGSTPGDLAGVLKALVDALNAVVAALGQPPVSGGGGSKGAGALEYAPQPTGIRKP